MARRRERTAGVWLVVLLVGGGGLAVVAAAGAGGWVFLKRAQERQRAAAEAERAADRAEAAAAFAAPVPPTPDEAAEFGRFFAALGADLRRGDGAAVARRFDTDRMAAEADRAGAFDRLPGGATREFRRGAAEGFRRAIGPALTGNELVRWDRTEVRRVRWAADRREAVVIAVHRDGRGAEETRLKMRWWLTGGPGGWKVYDLEDLDIGSRLSLLMRHAFTPEMLDRLKADPAAAAAVQGAAAAVQEALAALVLRQDADAAEAALARARGVDVPGPIGALRELAEGTLLVGRGRPDEALARYDAADRLLPGMPLVALARAAALNLLGRHAEALEQARAYARELGPDAIALQQEGFALEGLGRDGEAAAAYGRSLDDDPDGVDALAGLRRVLAGDKAELVDRLAKAPKAADLYDDLVSEARGDEDAAGLKALAAGLARAAPDDPRVGADEVRGLVEAGKFADAAAALKTRLGKAGPGNPTEDLLGAYLYAMLRAGRPLDAYAAVPPAHAGYAFRTLASDLEDEVVPVDPDKPGPDQPDPAAGHLAGLIAAHRKADPGDPWLWFYEASLLQDAGKYAEAETEYAAGADALEKRAAEGKPVGGFGDDPAADARDDFRSRRVACLYRLKRGLEAYRRVGPATDTFRQLAGLYRGADDPAGLAALIDAHQPHAAGDPVVLYWRAEVADLKNDHRAAAAGYAAYRKAAAGREGEKFTAQRAWDKQVRSLVRAGDAAAARAVVGEQTGDDADPVLAAVVAAAAGDAAGVERLMDAAAAGPGGVARFYWDADFVRLTAGPGFDAVRKKHPDPRPKPPPGPTG